jgi:hypothetical protein
MMWRRRLRLRCVANRDKSVSQTSVGPGRLPKRLDSYGRGNGTRFQPAASDCIPLLRLDLVGLGIERQDDGFVEDQIL